MVGSDMQRSGERSGQKKCVIDEEGGERLLPVFLIRWVALFVFLALLTLGLLTRGAVNPMICSIIAGILGAITFFVLIMYGEPKATAPVFRIAIAIILVLVGWVVAQVLPIENMANPVWRDLGEFIATHSMTISVAPADSLAALVTLALPFVVFVTALALFPSDEEALRLLSYIALLGGVLALWAICEFLFSPHTLLVDEKRYYLDSLTAPFVNRNTAGTFYGLVSLVSAARIYIEVRQTDFRRLIFKTELARGKKRARWHLGIQIILFIASLVALLLTKSRGGVGSTFAAYLLFVPLVLWAPADGRGRAPSFGSSRQQLIWRFVRTISGLMTVLIIGIVFADRALFRAEVQGLDDGRFCVAPAILRAARDNQLTGVGFATFRLFFPAYRDAQCGISGVWDRAHSVYLEAYLGLGLMFFVVLAVGVGMLVWTFVRGIGARRRLRPYPALGLAILLLVLAHSSIDFSLQIPGFAAIFAAAMAALVTISRGRSSASARREQHAQPIGKIRTIERTGL